MNGGGGEAAAGDNMCAEPSLVSLYSFYICVFRTLLTSPAPRNPTKPVRLDRGSRRAPILIRRSSASLIVSTSWPRKGLSLPARLPVIDRKSGEVICCTIC